LFEM